MLGFFSFFLIVGDSLSQNTWEPKLPVLGTKLGDFWLQKCPSLLISESQESVMLKERLKLSYSFGVIILTRTFQPGMMDTINVYRMMNDLRKVAAKW